MLKPIEYRGRNVIRHHTIMFNERIFKTGFFSRGGLDHEGAIEWGICPLFFWGPPGIAKTSKMKTLARLFGCDYVKVLHLQNQGPAEIGGAMFPHESREYFERIPAKWVIDANNAKRALIVFDEFGDAPLLNQALAQTILNERQVGDTFLKGHVRMAVLGNPPEMSTSPNETGMAAANRGAHKDLMWNSESTQEWMKWVMEDCGEVFHEPQLEEADALEAAINKSFPKDLAHAKGQMLSFVRANPELLEIPPEGSKDRGRAWASPRTHEFMLRWLAACKFHQLSNEERDEGIEMIVGKARSIKFNAWSNQQNIPDIEGWLDGKVKFDHDPSRPDITMHVFTTAAALLCDVDTRRKTRLGVMYKMLKAVSEESPGLCLLAAETLNTNKNTRTFKNDDSRNTMINLYDAKDIWENA